MDWSDLQYFIALAEEGSVRTAAQKLKVSHSTISRRISALESDLGVRLFDRLPSGYQLTEDGQGILADVADIKSRVNNLELRISGQDDKLCGPLRVTMPDIVACQALMPYIVRFTQDYPDIELDIIATSERLSLDQREADIAIRITDKPPENMVGRRVGVFRRANYVSKDYLKEVPLEKLGEEACWIGWDDDIPFPEWVKTSAYPNIPALHNFPDALLQVSAVREGLGIAMMPCFIADQDPSLIRVPDDRSEDAYELWMFTHQDLRHSSKVKAFMDAMVEAFQKLEPLLQGQTYLHPSA